MTELEKYELINGCETIKELEEAILKIADVGYIKGRTRNWDAEKQSKYVYTVVQGIEPANRLTRSYGIRQQALYLQHYKAD